jgi:hypothetical protein
LLGYSHHRSGNDGGGGGANAREGKRLLGLPECLTRAPLDLLLLDNTYCNPVYRFPTRADAVRPCKLKPVEIRVEAPEFSA